MTRRFIALIMIRLAHVFDLSYQLSKPPEVIIKWGRFRLDADWNIDTIEEKKSLIFISGDINFLPKQILSRISHMSRLMTKSTKWHVSPAKTKISLGIRPLSAQRRLWSDWADAQADLSLCWAHMPFCWFCHEAAQLCFKTEPSELDFLPEYVLDMHQGV